MFANQMLLRGYNLTGEQVKTLEKSILSVPTDTARFALFQERIAHAKLTVIGAPLMNLEMKLRIVQNQEVHIKSQITFKDLHNYSIVSIMIVM